MISLQWVLIQSEWCPYKKKKLGHTHTHTLACEDARRQPSTSQGEWLAEETNVLTP